LEQVENKEYIENAQQIKSIIQSENGVYQAVKRIESVVHKLRDK